MNFLNKQSAKTRFIGLAIGCAVLIAVSVGAQLWDGEAAEFGEIAPIPIYDGEELSDVSLIRIETSEAGYSFRRVGERWVMEEKAGFYVDADKIDQLFAALKSVQLVARTTARADRLDALGLGSPENGGFGAQLSMDSVTPIVIFGVKGGRQYARYSDQDQSWRADTLLPPLHNPDWWLDLPDLLDDAGFSAIMGVQLIDGAELPEEDVAFFQSVLIDMSISDVRVAENSANTHEFWIQTAGRQQILIRLKQENGEDWIEIPGRGELDDYDFRIDALSASDLASLAES